MNTLAAWNLELTGTVLFWAGILSCAWTFVLYPAFIHLLARTRPPPAAPVPRYERGELPSATVIICAHNEESRIRARIENLLLSEYPEGRLDILVVSDGSTDSTAQVVRSMDHDNVQVLERPEKSGKPACLNAAAEQAAGEVIVFADARQTFAPDAIHNLVRHFKDPAVGAVSGQLFPHASKGGAAQGIDFYWKLEKSLRHAEAQLDSCIGCTGAVYALRRTSYKSLPTDTLLDDVVLPMRAAQSGLRILFDPDARAYDPQKLDPAQEKTRKARTLAGNFQMLFRHAGWLMPWKSRLWWKLASHKYSRLLTPFSLAAALAGAWLAQGVFLYQLAFWAQALLYALAAAGLIFRGLRTPLLTIPAGFLFLAWMVVRGFLYYVSGRYKSGWDKSG